MSDSYTETETRSFTVTNARYLASKVNADLKRMQRFYGKPTDSSIAAYEMELVELLKARYLNQVTYGFRRYGNWIEPTLRYTAHELTSYFNDDDPGRVWPGANISGASFYSYLEYSITWTTLTSTQKEAFYSTMPFRRTVAPRPGVTGHFESDRIYSSGGWELGRASVRSSK